MHLQQVHLRINDAATGKPTPVRLRITDADGNYYAPYGRLTEMPQERHLDVGGNVVIDREIWAYIDGTCEILLPPGELHFEIAKGPEYKPINETIALLAGKMSMRFTIERWSNIRERGWHAGDMRVHFLSPDAALLEGQAEDLAVVNLLARNSSKGDLFPFLEKTVPNLLSFSGQTFARHAGSCGVAVNTFNHRYALGNPTSLSLLNCHRIVYPLFIHANEDAWTAEDWCDQCHRKNGLVVDASSGCSDDFRSWETRAALLIGKIDAVEAWGGWVDQRTIRKLTSYGELYDLFDIEFLFALAGASASWGGSQIGLMRTYAHISVGNEFNYANWIEAVRHGRTFVSTGPLLDFTINGEVPARSYRLSDADKNLQIRVEATSPVPYDFLELVWNGDVIQCVKSDASFPYNAKLEQEFTVRESGWLAVRCLVDRELSRAYCAQAHSSPVGIHLDTAPRWARQDTLRKLVARFDEVIAWTRTRTHPARPRLLHLYEQARTVLAKKLS
jgi:hypothetical protein